MWLSHDSGSSGTFRIIGAAKKPPIFSRFPQHYSPRAQNPTKDLPISFKIDIQSIANIYFRKTIASFARGKLFRATLLDAKCARIMVFPYFWHDPYGCLP